MDAFNLQKSIAPRMKMARKFLRSSSKAMPEPKSLGFFFVGLMSGAVLMLALDPANGRRRRALVRDKAVKAKNTASDITTKFVRNIINRVRGLRAEAMSRSHPVPVDDRTLMERVRSEIGRKVRHPGAVVVTVAEGVVTLSGPILEDEVRSVIKRAMHVRGVKRVTNQLEIHRQAGHVSALQGQGKQYLQ